VQSGVQSVFSSPNSEPLVPRVRSAEGKGMTVVWSCSLLPPVVWVGLILRPEHLEPSAFLVHSRLSKRRKPQKTQQAMTQGRK
jgi:hypothetical protein